MVSKIGKLGEGKEREGFEPSVSKSLHSSSSATPSTTRPSLLHNDYDLKNENRVNKSLFRLELDYWVGTTNQF